MERIDRTDPHRKMRRHTRRMPGVMPKTIVWFEEVGAERKPQKMRKVMRSAYKKTMMEYWWSLDPRYAKRAQTMRVYTCDDND